MLGSLLTVATLAATAIAADQITTVAPGIKDTTNSLINVGTGTIGSVIIETGVGDNTDNFSTDITIDAGTATGMGSNHATATGADNTQSGGTPAAATSSSAAGAAAGLGRGGFSAGGGVFSLTSVVVGLVGGTAAILAMAL
ncbi:hypothetical protein Sste5346_004787 [Sporothrix stenoceras]|uniref:Period circadian protein n=1 Tax=Sporothrix stenoceras TaxID=5173 RepID=A0ABR3Z6V9_9PEZI